MGFGPKSGYVRRSCQTDQTQQELTRRRKGAEQTRLYARFLLPLCAFAPLREIFPIEGLRLPTSTKARTSHRSNALPWPYIVLAAVCGFAIAGIAIWNSKPTEAWQRPGASKLKPA